YAFGIPSSAAASRALARSRDAIAVTSQYLPRCIPGRTFNRAILAVLSVPQRTFSIYFLQTGSFKCVKPQSKQSAPPYPAPRPDLTVSYHPPAVSKPLRPLMATDFQRCFIERRQTKGGALKDINSLNIYVIS